MTDKRNTALDVLRGTAILGTLGTNVWIFTDPRGAAGFLDPPGPHGAAGFAETLLRLVADGKFLGLLCLLFGVGLEIQYRSARRRGARWPGWYLWRAVLLFVEGALHYLLIFEFDVLTYYAIVSVLVAFLMMRSERAMRWCLAVVGTTHVLVLLLITAAAPGTAVSRGPSTSDWFAGVADRLAMAGTYRAEAFFVIPLSTVLFLAGVLLMRAGVLDDSVAGQQVRRRLMGWCLGIGVPLDLVTGFAGTQWFFVERYAAAPLVSLGLLGLVTEYVRRRPSGGWLRAGLSAIGRTALSAYIGQNLLGSVLCYGWGLGLAGLLAWARPWWVPACWALICLLLMLGARWWTRRFPRGPVESAWQWAYQWPQRSGVAASRK